MKLSEVTGGRRTLSGLGAAEDPAAKRKAALAQSMANIEADKEGYRATSGMTGGEKFRAGIGAGLIGTWDRVGNLVLPKALGLEGGRYTEEAIQARKQREADLTSTGAGMAGKMVGEIAATAPIGLAARGVVGGANALRGGSQAAQMASLTGPGSRVARMAAAALEGAGSGAATSDIGKGGGAALMGAGTGALFSGAGEAVGAMRGRATDEARQLMQETGEFIPASHATPEGSLIKQAYEGVVSNLPGSNIRAQRRAAVEGVRRNVLEAALPEGAPVGAVMTHAREGTPMTRVMEEATKMWDSAFDDVNKATINGFDVPVDMADAIAARSKDIVIPQAGVPMSGKQMLDFQKAANQLAKEVPAGILDEPRKKAFQDLANSVDPHIGGELKGTLSKFGDDVGDTFQKNKNRWKQWNTLKNVTSRSKNAEFTPSMLERAAVKRNDKVLKPIAERASKVLTEFPSKQGPFQMQAALGMLGVLGGGGVAGWMGSDNDASVAEKLRNAGIGAGVGYAGSKAISSKLAQKALVDYGTKGQKLTAATLRQIGALMRRGTIAGINSEENQ